MNTSTTMMQIPRSTAITTSKAPAGICEHVRRDAPQTLMQQQWPGQSKHKSRCRNCAGKEKRPQLACQQGGHCTRGKEERWQLHGTASLSLPNDISHHFPDAPRPLKAVPCSGRLDSPRNINPSATAALCHT